MSKQSTKKCNEQNLTDVTQHPKFHSTKDFLMSYRDIGWSLQTSVQNIIDDFQSEFGESIDEFLKTMRDVGADLSNTSIEYHAKTLERSRKMLRALELCVNIMRTSHKYGELYYWVLYYTYFIPQKLSVSQIVKRVENHVNTDKDKEDPEKTFSRATYFRKVKKAVKVIDVMLWGYTSRRNIAILNELFPE